jgi:hypothetical protein
MQARSTQKAALSTPSTAWLTSGQGRHSRLIDLLTRYTAAHTGPETLGCIHEGQRLPPPTESRQPASVLRTPTHRGRF